MRAWGFAVVWLVACEPMEPSPEGIFAPVRERAPAPAAAAPAPGPDEYDFASEERGPERPATDVASALGIEGTAVELPAPAPAAVVAPSAPEVLAPVAAAPPAPFPPPVAATGTWGVRLVSTVLDAQPPRAILGLPDGSEQVVTPGALVPGAGIVVLAIGRDAVQVAEIVPSGDHARIETRVIPALYPAAPPPR